MHIELGGGGKSEKHTGSLNSGYPVYFLSQHKTVTPLTLTFELPSRNSSLNPVKLFSRLALTPRGGSMVILELFWRTGTGNLGLGILVSHRRKSR